MATILVIEDDRQLRTALCRLLQSTGHRILEAENGGPGLEQFQRELCDAVFCDLYMPEKDGLETIRELRRQSSRVQIVAMGRVRPGAPDFLRIALSLGANQILIKPFGGEALAEVLGKLNLSA